MKAYFSYAVRALILSLVPIIVNSYSKDKPVHFLIGISIAGTLLALFIIYWIEKIMMRIRIFRKYGKYEGKWLQILNTSNRPYSMCEIIYDPQKGYVFKGRNYSTGAEEGSTDFESRHVVIDDSGMLCSIRATQNYKPHYKEGLGYYHYCNNFLSTLTTMRGYFYDTISEKSEAREVMMAKYNSIVRR